MVAQCVKCEKTKKLYAKGLCRCCYKQKMGKALHLRRKAELFTLLGDMCECCGEATPQFLTIEHKNNDGAADRRNNPRTDQIVKRILAEVKKGSKAYGLLCFNCNCAKGVYGTCPHTWKEPG